MDITKAKFGESKVNINSTLVRDEVISTEGFLPKSQYFPKNRSFLGKTSNQLIKIGIITSNT